MTKRAERYLIYGLCDPITRQIRYVGKSCSGLRRPKQHFQPSSLKITSRKNNWIKSVYKKCGTYPEIVILQECNATNICDLEIEFIAKYDNLTNQAPGGIGGGTSETARLKWRPIIATNIKTGEIRKYRFVSEAVKDGFVSTTVSSVCRGRFRQYKGFHFKYADGSSPPYRKPKKYRVITVVNKSTGEEKEYPTLLEAARALKVDRETLRSYLKKGNLSRSKKFTNFIIRTQDGS